MVLTLVPAVLVLAGQAANAEASGDVAVSSSPFVVGPVGIAVVALGFGGLIVGLIRHRRRAVAAAPVVDPSSRQEPIISERRAA